MFRAAFEPTSCALALSIAEATCRALFKSPKSSCPRAKIWLKRVAERQHDLVLDAALNEAADFLTDTAAPLMAVLFGLTCCAVCLHYGYHMLPAHTLHTAKRRGTRTLARARRLVVQRGA